MQQVWNAKQDNKKCATTSRDIFICLNIHPAMRRGGTESTSRMMEAVHTQYHGGKLMYHLTHFICSLTYLQLWLNAAIFNLWWEHAHGNHICRKLRLVFTHTRVGSTTSLPPHKVYLRQIYSSGWILLFSTCSEKCVRCKDSMEALHTPHGSGLGPAHLTYLNCTSNYHSN